MLEDILRIIEGADRGERLVVAIDGKCATGKTTLAGKLAEKLDADVIHMDDFFLPLDKRTPERLAEPGGNVDYERFMEEVLMNLDKEEFSYRKFSCSTMDFLPEKLTVDKRTVIIEGVYSLRPEMRKFHDLEFICRAPLHVRLERILKRGGREAFDAFTERWIPLEDEYFNSVDFRGIPQIGIF